MPPKKATTKRVNASPARRSARLQSREPSVETESVSESAIAAMLSPEPIVATPPTAVKEKRPVSRMRRELTLKKIHDEYAASQRQAAPSSPSRPLATSPKQQEAAEPSAATTTPPSQSPAEREPQQSGWRKLLTSFGGYFPASLTRKRHAEEDDQTPQPSPKRTRVEDYTQTSPQTSTQPKHSPTRDYTVPAAKDPTLATSLSTIAEITETSDNSFLSNTSQIEANTPSRPPRHEPQQRSLLSVSQNTPQTRPNTPRRTPQTMRRAAQLRAARDARHAPSNIGTPDPTGFPISTLRSTPGRPVEPNADARKAKLDRMRALQKELEELEEDEDIKEMQSHRRKRVKVDHLVTIPHNLPGDSSSTFRVPEVDSDDEMEVDYDVEERSNIFDEAEKMDEGIQAQKETPAQKAMQSQMDKPMQDAQSQHDPKSQLQNVYQRQGEIHTQQARPQPTIQQPQPLQQQPHNELIIEWDFPDVGPPPADYYVTEEFKANAHRKFEEGLAEFLKTY